MDDPPLTLTEKDTREIIQLLGEVIALSGTYSQKKRYLMDGLCRMIGGDAWAWSLVHLQENSAPRQVVMLHHGFDEERLAKWAEVIENPAMKHVTDQLVKEATSSVLGLTRKSADCVAATWWDSSETSYQLWREIGFRSFLLSAWPLEGGGFSGIGIYRNTDRPQFDARECRIAHILFSEVPWLHGEGIAGTQSNLLMRLTPRQRTALHLLVQGWSRKEIAAHLGLSINTVHSYARDVFKHFGVHTQSELIARFTRGDGRDK